jgi:hypothetical protein
MPLANSAKAHRDASIWRSSTVDQHRSAKPATNLDQSGRFACAMCCVLGSHYVAIFCRTIPMRVGVMVTYVYGVQLKTPIASTPKITIETTMIKPIPMRCR